MESQNRPAAADLTFGAASWASVALTQECSKGVTARRAGTTSEPFEGGEHAQVAVKVIDDRGNELLVVKKVDEAE
jgi:adenine-specific DNA-methyltransferase